MLGHNAKKGGVGDYIDGLPEEMQAPEELPNEPMLEEAELCTKCGNQIFKDEEKCSNCGEKVKV